MLSATVCGGRLSLLISSIIFQARPQRLLRNASYIVAAPSALLMT